MQAGQQFVTSGRYYYGYNGSSNNAYGDVAPKFIEWQGKQYKIEVFYTTPYGISLLGLTPETPFTTIVFEVNGKKYTMAKNADTGSFKFSGNIFTDTSTYIIKILSIQ